MPPPPSPGTWQLAHAPRPLMQSGSAAACCGTAHLSGRRHRRCRRSRSSSSDGNGGRVRLAPPRPPALLRHPIAPALLLAGVVNVTHGHAISIASLAPAAASSPPCSNASKPTASGMYVSSAACTGCGEDGQGRAAAYSAAALARQDGNTPSCRRCGSAGAAAHPCTAHTHVAST